MLKNTIIALGILFTVSGTVSAAGVKVGIVNMKQVVSKVPQAKMIEDKIRKKFKDRTDALIALRKKGEETQTKARRDAMTLTNAQKREVQRKLKSLDSEFNLKQTFLQDDIALMNKQEQASLLRKISDAVNKVAKKEKLDLVVTSDSVMYVKPSMDISKKVIALLNNPKQ